MNKKAIQEAILIADSLSNLKHQAMTVYTIRDLCRRLEEADQVIDQRNAELSAREWVGLTDEERWACTQSPFTAENYYAIEAKLKEKNYGIGEKK